jgi:hypothetical protein
LLPFWINLFNGDFTTENSSVIHPLNMQVVKKNMSNHQSVQCILLPIPWLPMLKRGLQFPLSKLATRALRRFARFSTARLASLLTRNRPSATPRRLVVFQLRSSRFSGNEHCILSYEKMWRIYGWILKSPDWLLIIYNC